MSSIHRTPPPRSVLTATRTQLFLTKTERLLCYFFLRGSNAQNSFDNEFELVASIKLVFEDIKRFSKGGITDIRVAVYLGLYINVTVQDPVST